MNGDLVVEMARAAWLTLAFMMLLSRVIFQAAGAERMRAFLDGWQRGRVKRVWGAATVSFAAFLAAGAASARGSFEALDITLVATLVTVLGLDGLVNVLPTGFETFKDRLQHAWLRRAGGTSWEGDSRLFGTVNALLAAASAGVAAAVTVYRPIATQTVLVAVVAATVLTCGLIIASILATRPKRDSPRLSVG
jgi:hypothetical protein